MILLVTLIQIPVLAQDSSEWNKARRAQLRTQIMLEEVAKRWESRLHLLQQEAIVSRASFAVRAHEQDSLALVQFYDATAGPTWFDHGQWLVGPVSEWYGVTLDADGRVSTLSLRENNLFGFIPTVIGSLTALDTLDLSVNFFLGSIPDTLGTLPSLRFLGLGQNILGGTIPESLSGLSQLRSLRLDNNLLRGEIPASYSNLTNLEDLFLWNNMIEGAIPVALGDLAALKRLYLDGNQLTGSIPVSLGNLTELRELFLDINELTGVIPGSLGNLENLAALFLSFNQLEGRIPDSFGNLARLEVLSLGKNLLSGPLPETLGNLYNLSNLYLNENRFKGSIPTWLFNLFGLTRLYLAGNEFSGIIPDGLGNNQNLKEIVFADNLLSGTIPEAVAMLPILDRLDLSGNQLVAPLPGVFSSSIRILELNDNQFTGPFPDAIQGLPRLQVLDLSRNRFSGTISPNLSLLVALQQVSLSFNELEGSLPGRLDRLGFLEILLARGNQLEGEIPRDLFDAVSLLELDIGQNNLEGTIPKGLGQLSRLRHLNLDGNQLSGAVPQEITDLSDLMTLDISDNLLDVLPDLSTLPVLEMARLQNNLFTFEDFELNLNLMIDSLVLGPQKAVITRSDRSLTDVTFSVKIGGQNNRYQWYRNNVLIDGAVDSEYHVDLPETESSDSVHCEISNTLISSVTLYSAPVRLDAVLSSIDLTPAEISIAYGDTIQFNITGIDQFGNVHHFTPVWSALGGTINEEGVFIAGNQSGSFTVVVTDQLGLVSGQSTVNISPAGPTPIESPKITTTRFALHNNYPNPFSSSTRIAFDIGYPTTVKLKVFDMLGREIDTLVDGLYNPGHYEVTFFSESHPSGLYLYRIDMGDISYSRGMLIVR